ncbi:hypothetical protein Btru_007646 [Bulinus truncatus]|nr:hypothetical protein Btru_007646 [Bulinus truncatus]
MTDTFGQDNRPPTSSKEKLESLSSRIKDGVGRHLATVSHVGNQHIQSLRNRISSTLNRSDGQVNHVEVEDSGTRLASHSKVTEKIPAQISRSGYVHRTTPASLPNTGGHDSAPFSHPTSTTIESRIVPTAPFQETFQVNISDHSEKFAVNIVSQAKHTDKQTGPGRPNLDSLSVATSNRPPAQDSNVAGIKKNISQPDLLIQDMDNGNEPRNSPTNRTESVSKRHSFPVARTFSPESDSAEVLNISADNPRQKAAALLVSPCLETRESILNKSCLHHSDIHSGHDRSSSSDDTLHLAVPLFTKDVHMAYKGFINSESQESPRPPPESVFPKRTIIVNRFDSGSPYLDIPSYRSATTDKNVTKNTQHTLNAPPGATLDDSHPSQGVFHVSVSSKAPPSVHVPPMKMYPYLSSSVVHPFPMPMAPPSLSAPPMPQPVYYWTQHAPHPPAPYVEPMNAHRAPYSRQEEENMAGTNYRRFPAFNFRKKMESGISFLFGSKRAGLRDETCCGHPPYNERQSSLNNMFNIGRDSSFSGQGKGYERGPDDLLLQMACCCCWPIGLAAKLLICMFPNEVGRGSCLGTLSRQVSIYILLLGTALYIFIMVVFISMLLALSKDSHH